VKNVVGEELEWVDSIDGRRDYYSKIYSPIPKGTVVSKLTMDVWTLDKLGSIEGINTAIDIGCNYGKTLGWFKYNLGIENVCGVDLPGVVDIAVNYLSRYYKYKDGDIEFVHDLFDKYDFGDRSFDLVYFSNTLEHIPDWIYSFEKSLSITNIMNMCIVPKDRSWDWSEDHLHLFSDETIDYMLQIAFDRFSFRGEVDVVECDQTPGQFWYCMNFTKDGS
jgi:hypothetical protein